MRDSACPTSPHLHPRWRSVVRCYHFFFFNDTATTEIYTLPLHDALPISTRLATRRPTSSADRCSPAKNTASATARRCCVAGRLCSARWRRNSSSSLGPSTFIPHRRPHRHGWLRVPGPLGGCLHDARDHRRGGQRRFLDQIGRAHV